MVLGATVRDINAKWMLFSMVNMDMSKKSCFVLLAKARQVNDSDGLCWE